MTSTAQVIILKFINTATRRVCVGVGNFSWLRVCGVCVEART